MFGMMSEEIYIFHLKKAGFTEQEIKEIMDNMEEEEDWENKQWII